LRKRIAGARTDEVIGARHDANRSGPKFQYSFTSKKTRGFWPRVPGGESVKTS
jgi:hypothetical protein